MYHYECGEKVFKMPTSWDEVSLETYIKLAKLDESRSEFKMGELYLFRMLELITQDEEGNPIAEGDLDNLPLTTINTISEHLTWVRSLPDMSKDKTFEIDGVLYSAPDDFKKLTIGEFISIKTYQESATSVWDVAPNILAILWRPTTKIWDEERKDYKLKREPFKLDNLEWRKDMLLKQPALKVLSSLIFFSILTPSFNENTEVSTNDEQKTTEQIGDPAITS